MSEANEIMTLDEAFKQRSLLKQAGKAIFIRWHSADLHAVSFSPEQPHPNRYRIIITLEHNTGQIITLPADTPVYIK